MRNVFKLLPAALGLFALVSCNSDDFGSASQVDLTGKAVLEVTDGDEGLTRSFKTATLGTQWETGDVLRVYDDKLQAYYNFDYATADGSAKFVYNGDKDLTNFAATYVLYGVEASDLSYAGWKDEKNIALLKVKSAYDYSESDASTVGYKSILPMLGKVNEVDKSGAQPWLKATTFTLTARAKVTFKNGAGAGVKRVRARALKFETGKDIEDVTLAAKEATAGWDGTSSAATNAFEGIATETGAPKLNGWFEAVLDKDITAATTEGGLQACDETVVNNAAATNTIEVAVADGAMEDYTNCIFFPIAPGDYDLIVFEYSLLDADVTSGSTDATNWQYIGYAAGTINRTMKFGDFSDAATAICPTDLTIETEIEITRQNIKNTEALTQLMADQNNDNAAVKIIIDNETGSEPLTSLSGAESQWTIYIPQLKNDMTIDVQGTTDLTAHQLVIKDVAGADNSAYNVNFNFKEFKSSSKAIQIETTAKVLLTGDYTALPAVADGTAIDVVKTAGLTLGTTTESFKANGKEIDVAAGDVTFVRGTINRLLNTAEGNTINVNGTASSTISRLNAGSNATANINSGTVTTTAATGTSTVNVAGGHVKTITATSKATVTMTGGEVDASGAISTTQGALTIGPADDGATIAIAGDASLETTTGVVTIDAKDVTVPALTIKGTTSLNLNNGVISKLNYTGSDDEDAPIEVTVASKGKSAIKTVEVTTSTYATATYTSSFDATLTGNEKAEAVNEFGTAFACVTGSTDNFVPIYTAAQLAGAESLSGAAALVTEITDLKGWASPNLSQVFNGNNKEITTDAPLFGILNANVSNIKKLTVNINKTATTIGALAKQTSSANITITKVAIEGSIAAQNKVGGVFGVTATGTVTFGDGTTSGANAYKNAVTVNVTFTNNTSYPGTMARNLNAGTFGKFVGQAGGSVTIKADCSVGSAAFDKDALHFGYNRILDAEGVITHTFQGNTDLIGYSPATNYLQYAGKTFTNVYTTDASGSGKFAYNATTKKVTGNVYYIGTGAAAGEGGDYVGLTTANKTAINNAVLSGTTIPADADWSGVTVYAHNSYVEAE